VAVSGRTAGPGPGVTGGGGSAAADDGDDRYVRFPCADLDSHLMELPGWLADHAEEPLRSALRPLDLTCAGASTPTDLERTRRRLAAGPAPVPPARELLQVKGWAAYGGSDPAERSAALDRLGFEAQLVISTLATTQLPRDPDLHDAGVRAHNRAMAAFCSGDDRLLPAGFVPLTDPARSARLAQDAVDLGCAAVLIPFGAPPRSPGHPDYDPVWAVLAEAGVPAAFHLGHGPQTIHPAFHQTGSPSTDFLGSERSLRAKDAVVAHHGIEVFLAALVLDGVFDRHPGLAVVCMEFGAGWVPDFRRRLDLTDAYRSTEPLVDRLARRPSEYVAEHMLFCPQPDEDLAELLPRCPPEMLAFASDFPHPEGGTDPVGRFLEGLRDADDRTRALFFRENFRRVLGR
jgi:predicted TIM-barrel fold metal-dependent hydrolase